VALGISVRGEKGGDGLSCVVHQYTGSLANVARGRLGITQLWRVEAGCRGRLDREALTVIGNHGAGLSSRHCCVAVIITAWPGGIQERAAAATETTTFEDNPVLGCACTVRKGIVLHLQSRRDLQKVHVTGVDEGVSDHGHRWRRLCLREVCSE
jgi:hypothetical protein